jgi:CheY-like chemotaxis protein
MKIDLRSDLPELATRRTQAPARIMVVDDDPFVRTVLADALSGTGAVIKTFASGDEALAAAQTLQPDLVLLDLRMQGMDGRATAQALRKKHATARMIFLTADGDAAAHVGITSLGAAGIITKPFDPTTVVDLIQHLLGSAPISVRPAQFDTIAAEFRDSLADTMKSIKSAWAEVRAHGWQKSSAESILDKAHMLAGTAGLFHMHTVGSAADRVEGMLQEVMKTNSSPSAAILTQLETEICDLAQACDESLAAS